MPLGPGRAAGEPPHPEGDQPMEFQAPSGGRVLIVDDNPDIRYVLAEILRDHGFTVDTAPNGQAALLVLYHRPRPHLILLDLTMPVMDGWEFRRQQEQDPELSSIPVAVVT